MTVKNRRIKVEQGEAHNEYDLLFKAKLWKLKTEGDRNKAEDWFQRDMWIAQNGSLVYFSPKEDRDLVYYTAADVATAKVEKVKDGEACRSFCFRVILPPTKGVEFTPGEFAAESPSQLQQWLSEFAKFSS